MFAWKAIKCAGTVASAAQRAARVQALEVVGMQPAQRRNGGGQGCAGGSGGRGLPRMWG